MAERIDLTTPETKPTNSTYRIERITEDWDAGTIVVQLKGTNGEAESVFYGPLGCVYRNALIPSTPTGLTLLRLQNKANFSVNSRQRAIYNRITADVPQLTGTVSGVPD